MILMYVYLTYLGVHPIIASHIEVSCEKAICLDTVIIHKYY